MLHKYRKKTLIEAEQFDGRQTMMVKYGIFAHPEAFYFMDDPLYTIKTKNGDMEVKPYDYIDTGADGEHWAIDKDIFEKTYERCDQMKHEAEQELLKTLNGQLSELPTVAKTMIQQYQTSAIVLSIIFGVLFIATLIITIWLALYFYKKEEVSNSYNNHYDDYLWDVLIGGIFLNTMWFISLIINIIHACTPITSIIRALLNQGGN